MNIQLHSKDNFPDKEGVYFAVNADPRQSFHGVIAMVRFSDGKWYEGPEGQTSIDINFYWISFE